MACEDRLDLKTFQSGPVGRALTVFNLIEEYLVAGEVEQAEALCAETAGNDPAAFGVIQYWCGIED